MHNSHPLTWLTSLGITCWNTLLWLWASLSCLLFLDSLRKEGDQRTSRDSPAKLNTELASQGTQDKGVACTPWWIKGQNVLVLNLLLPVSFPHNFQTSHYRKLRAFNSPVLVWLLDFGMHHFEHDMLFPLYIALQRNPVLILTASIRFLSEKLF